MPLTLEDAWIKAAVEHRLVTITYKNPETALVYTKRDVRPDWVGPDRSGQTALWGLLNHNPFVGMKSFTPQNFQFFQVTNQKFQPTNEGRWKDLVQLYQQRGLEKQQL
jgi:hypothetical protein